MADREAARRAAIMGLKGLPAFQTFTPLLFPGLRLIGYD